MAKLVGQALVVAGGTVDLDATVRDKLRVFSDELRAGILCSGLNGGSHERTLEMMELFAREVMPHFREDAHVDETAGVGR